MRCIPPGIQQMPAHHTHQHHHHHHHNLYNIGPDAGELVPPQPPRHEHHQAPPAPRAEPARMASAEGGRGAASAPQAQGQRGRPARGAEEGRPWDRDWGAVPDPLGEETLPLVREVYGWLCWANQGTSRRSRNRPFDAVLLRSHLWLMSKIPQRTWDDCRSTSERKSRTRSYDTLVDLLIELALERENDSHMGFAQRPRPLALPPAQPAAAAAPAPTQAAAQVKAQTAGTGELGGGAGPPDPRPPHGTARRKRARHLPREGVRRQQARGGTCCPAAR